MNDEVKLLVLKFFENEEELIKLTDDLYNLFFNNLLNTCGPNLENLLSYHEFKKGKIAGRN